jgi:hypothetical protein
MSEGDKSELARYIDMCTAICDRVAEDELFREEWIMLRKHVPIMMGIVEESYGKIMKA